MTGTYVHTFSIMGTVVTLEVVGRAQEHAEPVVARAVAWFERVEQSCNRFIL